LITVPVGAVAAADEGAGRAVVVTGMTLAEIVFAGEVLAAREDESAVVEGAAEVVRPDSGAELEAGTGVALRSVEKP
jgi:hypothetical protein